MNAILFHHLLQYLIARVLLYLVQTIRLDALRDCFLKTLWDTDATDFTEFRGKNRNKKVTA